MANSARDPYWQAAVRRETIDHPTHAADIQDECAACHMPMAQQIARAAGGKGEVFAHLPSSASRESSRLQRLAADGVSCTVCHQISRERLGTRDSFNGKFAMHADAGRRRAADLRTISDRCRPHDDHAFGDRLRAGGGAAHQAVGAVRVLPHADHAGLGPDGEVIGVAARADELSGVAAQRLQPRSSGAASRVTCRRRPGPVRASSVLGDARDTLARHVFVGGNALHGPTAEPVPQASSASRRCRPSSRPPPTPRSGSCSRTRRRSSLSSADARRGGTLAFDVDVRESHRPQVPDRLSVAPRVAPRHGQRTRAATRSSNPGAIDAATDQSPATTATRIRGASSRTTRRSPDPTRCRSTSRSSAIVGGVPTTGLLTATQYLKDNRLLPRGFDKTTAAAEIGVYGSASDDRDFAGGGDRVRYRVDRAVERAVHDRRGAAVPVDRLPLGAEPRALRRAGAETVRLVLQRHVGWFLGRHYDSLVAQLYER